MIFLIPTSGYSHSHLPFLWAGPRDLLLTSRVRKRSGVRVCEDDKVSRATTRSSFISVTAVNYSSQTKKKKTNLGRRVYLSYHFILKSIVAGESRGQELEAVSHIISTVREERSKLRLAHSQFHFTNLVQFRTILPREWCLS